MFFRSKGFEIVLLKTEKWASPESLKIVQFDKQSVVEVTS